MATKTSASAFNSYFYQQQHSNGGGGGASSTSKPTLDQTLNNNNNEQLNDLHVKMSKKIAQLTKVIYALNSKNDESENLIANLKAQYEEEKEQLILDTNRKLSEIKSKMAQNNDHTKRILSLEDAVKQYELQRERAIKEMEEFRLKSIENEESLVMSHRDEIIEMNKMLEQLKQDQEKQLKQSEAMLKTKEHEALYMIEDLKSKHRLEIESLKKSLSSNKDNFNVERQALEQKHELEREKLKQDLENLNSKYLKDKQDYDQNIHKLKTFHEKELDALRQNSTNEYEKLITGLKTDMETLAKQKKDIENELNKKYTLKLEEIVTKEDEIKNLNELISNLKLKFDDTSKSYSELNEKIMELSAKNQTLEAKLEQTELENNQFKEKMEVQNHQLLERAGEIGKLEASNMQKSSTISDLKHELSETRRRLTHLEDEKKIFENETLNFNEKNIGLIKSLENQIDQLTQEKFSMTKQFSLKIEDLEETSRKEIDKLKTDSQIEKQEMIDRYEDKLNMEMALYQEKILTLERDLTKNFNSENQKLLCENNELKSKYEKLINDYKLKTKNLDENFKNLQENFDKLKIELNESLTLNNNLNLKNKNLENDLSGLNDLSKKQKIHIDHLEKELENLKFIFESTTQDSQLEFKIRMDKLNKELNAKWEETLRVECENLRVELQRIKEEEKRVELENLSQMKNDELKNLRDIWQTKTNELLDEISLLKKELSEKELKSNEQLDKLRHDLEIENRDLIDKLNRLNDEYKRKLDELQSQQNLETKTLMEQLTKENESKIAEIKQRHLEDLKSQSIAQKASLSSLKSTLENSKNLEIEMLKEAHNKQMELMKYELQQEFYNEMDKLKHESEMELMTVRCELERAIELGKQKEREFEIKIDDYQSEIRHKQKQIDKISNELNELKLVNSTLKEEIELKQRELKQIRADAQNDIRHRESLMQQKKEEEMNRLNSEHMKQKQFIVNEFKQAQEMLKQKIIETDEKLREMHDRFLNRESRQEDLDLIQILRKNLGEKEDLLKKLQNEKQYFQMELVNRENNFNKMFNAAPNIGTINPLGANTKLKAKSIANNLVNKFQQAQAQQLQNTQTVSVARLDPIPGKISPLHDVNLNPNKPLPKKFLS